MSNPKQIVIVGGGYAGITLAQELQKKISSSEATIIVIEKRPFFFHAVGSLRAIVNQEYCPKIFIPNKDAFPVKQSGYFCSGEKNTAHRLVCGIAHQIEKDRVQVRLTTEDGTPGDKTEEIKFDYLILATGSLYSSPIKPADGVDSQQKITNELKQMGEKIKNAKTVLIVGGGAVGIEMAGEIASEFPDKKVTLIDGNDKLLARQNLTDKFRDTLMAGLKKKNIEVILGDRLPERMTAHGFEPKTIELASGKKIQADIQILCAGITPSSELIKKLDEKLVDDKNFIKVKQNMQIDSDKFENIFVVGDASSHATPKMAYWAGEQAKFLAKNLPALIRGKIQALPDFQGPTSEMILIPLGPKNGVSQMPFGIVVGDFMSRNIKSSDLFTTQFWKQMNAKLN